MKTLFYLLLLIGLTSCTTYNASSQSPNQYTSVTEQVIIEDPSPTITYITYTPTMTFSSYYNYTHYWGWRRYYFAGYPMYLDTWNPYPRRWYWSYYAWNSYYPWSYNHNNWNYHHNWNHHNHHNPFFTPVAHNNHHKPNHIQHNKPLPVKRYKPNNPQPVRNYHYTKPQQYNRPQHIRQQYNRPQQPVRSHHQSRPNIHKNKR